LTTSCVGSASSNDIAVSGVGVGEHHADLLIKGDKITLCPMTGCSTTVNGANVSVNRDLRVGDIVSFANAGMELILPVQLASGEAAKSVFKTPEPQVKPEELLVRQNKPRVSLALWLSGTHLTAISLFPMSAYLVATLNFTSLLEFCGLPT
jgi:hypothetical protein